MNRERTLKRLGLAEHDHGPGEAEGGPLELGALGVAGRAQVLEESLAVAQSVGRQAGVQRDHAQGQSYAVQPLPARRSARSGTR